jgi:stage II sporulation SpoE-like protein
MPGMSYEENEIVLEPRESALLYSGGLVEAHDPTNGEMFGFPRLRALVAEHGEKHSLGNLFLQRTSMKLTRMRATGTPLSLWATRLYTTPKHDRQMTTNSAHGEERQGV